MPKELAQKIAWAACDALFTDGGDQALVNTVVEKIDPLLRTALEEAKSAKTCAHCTGVLEKYQMQFTRGCLCKCHEGTIQEAKAAGYEEGLKATGGMFNRQDLRDSFHAGEKKAYEDAAKIVEEFDPTYLKHLVTMKEHIVKEIRRRASELNGK